MRPPPLYLFAVMGDRGEDGAERFEAHGDVQQVRSEEEVVVVSQDGHGGVPHQVQERLAKKHRQWGVSPFPQPAFEAATPSLSVFPLTLSVNTTPIFHTWYFVSMELNLKEESSDVIFSA